MSKTNTAPKKSKKNSKTEEAEEAAPVQTAAPQAPEGLTLDAIRAMPIGGQAALDIVKDLLGGGLSNDDLREALVLVTAAKEAVKAGLSVFDLPDLSVEVDEQTGKAIIRGLSAKAPYKMPLVVFLKFVDQAQRALAASAKSLGGFRVEREDEAGRCLDIYARHGVDVGDLSPVVGAFPEPKTRAAKEEEGKAAPTATEQTAAQQPQA